MAAPRPRLAPVTTTTASFKVPTNSPLSVNLLYPKFIDTENLSQTMYITHINQNNLPGHATEPTYQPHQTPPARRHARRTAASGEKRGQALRDRGGRWRQRILG